MNAAASPFTKQRRKAAELTQAELKQHLRYDPDTGHFTRLIANSPASKVGDSAGWIHPKGYVLIKLNGITYPAHRLAWLYVHGGMPEGDIDHKNMQPGDNRIDNLRPATRSQNQCNREKLRQNKTGFKGVSFHKASQRFVAQCSFNGKKHHIGLFDSAEAASVAYTKFSQQIQGEFARS